MTRINRGAALIAALLVTPALVAAATNVAVGADGGRSDDNDQGGGSLPLIQRAAAGPVDVQGGAAREDGDQTQLIRDSLRTGKVKNVILLIGDGMGDSEITVARNYLKGAGGFFAGIDALPLTGQMTHYSVNRTTGLPDYTPDSAATGTAWSTGVKTYDNAVSVDRHGTAYPTILQLAKASGRATGNITTSEIQDATPAVEIAHISARSCYGPNVTSVTCPEAAKENGGLGSISEQLLDNRADVTLGGGSTTFAENAKAGAWTGISLKDQAIARGYQYITAKGDLAGITAADQAKPLLGLFAPGNLPVKFAPAVATAGGGNNAAVTCQPNPSFANVPTLKDMTDKAIDLLSSSKSGRSKGFFLQVESASIDKQDHSADACGQIGETDQMDDAVQSALAFAQQHRNTLVIATADHAHTSQIVDNTTPGLSIKLHTADGADMIVAYGTAAAGQSQQHTGTQLRVAGYGPNAGNLVGLIDQTDLFFIMKRAMGIG